MDIERVAVVGAGLAGARICQELRARGYRGSLVLLGAEQRPPYDRPPLSKAVLLGDRDDTSLRPELVAGADIRLGVTATGVGDGVLATTAGDVPWDRLVLAVGAAPIRLPRSAPAGSARGGSVSGGSAGGGLVPAGSGAGGSAGGGSAPGGPAGGGSVPDGPAGGGSVPAGSGAGGLVRGGSAPGGPAGGGSVPGGSVPGGSAAGGSAFGGVEPGGPASGGPEPDEGAAYVLRTLDDARRLRAALRPGSRVVIIGAGWIGAEVATAAARRGAAVTVLEAAAAPLAAVLGARVGAHTATWYAGAGVTLRAGAEVSTVDGDGVTLRDGERLSADTVIEAVGVRPDLRWLAGSGVEVDAASGGVVVDAGCRTSQPGVFAVGDCAARWSPRTGRRIRTEHWDDALQAPAVAAAAVLGDPNAAYDPVPYVWSEQFGRFLQWVGWPDGEPAVWRGEPAGEAGWSVGWLAPDGRLTGLLAVDRQRDVHQARRLIDAGRVPDPARLANPGVPVREA